jgi:hypothetical protein
MLLLTKLIEKFINFFNFPRLISWMIFLLIVALSLLATLLIATSSLPVADVPQLLSK